MGNELVNPGHARPKPRRPLLFRILFGGFTLFALLFWVGFSMMVVTDYVRERDEYATYTALQDSGVIIQAVVIDRQVRSDEDGTSFYITYQFGAPIPDDPNGNEKQFTRTASVKAD